MVALCADLGAVFPHAHVRSDDPVWIRLPPYVAPRTPVRRTWPGRGRVRRCGSRTCTGLRVYGEVPGVGLLRARACTRVCNFGGVRHPGDPWPRNDAADRRPGLGGRAVA